MSIKKVSTVTVGISAQIIVRLNLNDTSNVMAQIDLGFTCTTQICDLIRRKSFVN